MRLAALDRQRSRDTEGSARDLPTSQRTAAESGAALVRMG